MLKDALYGKTTIAIRSQTVRQGWTLHEAVAWLAMKSDDAPSEILRKVRVHKRGGADGWLLAWVELSQELEKIENHPFAAIDETREKLRAACEAGRVRATGIPADRGQRRQIDPDDFVGAEIWHGEGAKLNRIVDGRGEPARWFELRFDSRDVRELAPWLAPDVQRGTKTRRSRFDHETFIAQGVEVMLDEGGFGPEFTRAILHDHMARWCSERWQRTPSRSWMYDRFDEIVKRYIAAVQKA